MTLAAPKRLENHVMGPKSVLQAWLKGAGKRPRNFGGNGAMQGIAVARELCFPKCS